MASYRFHRWASLFLTAIVLLAGDLPRAWSKTGEGELTLIVIDKATGEKLPCRVHLKNQAGVSKKVYGAPFWFDHSICPGELKLKLPKGGYTFLVERGHEYVDVSGHFQIEDNAEDQKTIELKRAVDMSAEDWWSGDLHVCRQPREIELAMQAEDLHVAGLVTWDNKKNLWQKEKLPESPIARFDENRYYHVLTGKDARAGGSLLFFGLQRPLPIVGIARDYPSSLDIITQARQQNPDVWIDAEKPFAWDLPVWLAAGHVQSIQIAHSHLLHAGMTKHEAGGRPRDKKQFPDPLGIGNYSEFIYHQVLNCGFRIPPTAGSGSGEANNPVAQNRVYVHVPKAEFCAETWWENLRAGRALVTNGPMIRPVANGQLPGHVFRLSHGDELNVDVALNLTTRYPVAYIEIIENGRVAESMRLDVLARTGHFTPFKITRSGWFLLRAVTFEKDVYRFATTAPWYVEIKGQDEPISKKSAQFFLDWVNDRAGMLKLAQPDEAAHVRQQMSDAQQFWQDLVQRASRP